MCIDADHSVIYLLGGWDGIQDLSDFWAFHCNSGNWECLSLDTVSDVSVMCYLRLVVQYHIISNIIMKEARENFLLYSSYLFYLVYLCTVAFQKFLFISLEACEEYCPY